MERISDSSEAKVLTSKINPYDTLISQCSNDAGQIQAHYENHRHNRNRQQRDRLLSPDFKGVEIDPVLYKLVNRSAYPNYFDPRHCLVFWARPTTAVKTLIREVQEKLKEVAPGLWFMPPENLHMTVMEITHSRTESEIASRLSNLEPQLEKVTNYTLHHRAKLIRPLLSFDASAMALSFVPAATNRESRDPEYTYLHLRRDLYAICSESGVEVDSRYVLPSAHLTVARFVSHKDTTTSAPAESDIAVTDPEKVAKLVGQIDRINEWLQESFWAGESGESSGCEWFVGQETGLDCNRGTLWYGNGDRVMIGQGF